MSFVSSWCVFFFALSSTAQLLGQRFEARGFRLHQPELVQYITEIREQARSPRTRSHVDVTAQQLAQMLQMIFHPLKRDAVDVDEFVVVAVDEFALQIEHI